MTAKSLARDTRRKREDGVRTLEDLRIRCVIDSETGCWLWRGAFTRSSDRRGQPTSRVWLPDAPDGMAKTGTATRAAWLLSGRELEAGHVVWRSRCTNSACINPGHGASGTRTAMHAAFVADGRLRGDPRRAAINARNRSSLLVPVEKVRRAEAMFAAGAMQKTVRAALGLSANSAMRIRKGLHPNCAGRQRTVANASVFTMRAAA